MVLPIFVTNATGFEYVELGFPKNIFRITNRQTTFVS